jgi:antitoxin VapB
MNLHKLSQLRALMRANHIETLLLQRSQNFAWLTDGAASYIGIASDTGAAAILVTLDTQYIITNNIEAERLQHEQGLADWEFVVGSWTDGLAPLVKKMTRGVLYSDFPFPEALEVAGKIAPLRYTLDEAEAVRYRSLGAATGRALQNATRMVRVGMTENEIAGILAQQCYANNVVPVTNLIAADERIFRWRHPLPTEKKLERYAMLVVGGRRWGLIASATRLVHFGPIPAEVRRKAEACAQVDAAFIRATQAGATLAEVFRAGMNAYAKEGFDGEWQYHHQGGLTGYHGRELLGAPTATHRIEATQAFAWNPSIKGTKSEDTILLTPNGVEVITQVDDWPLMDCGDFRRPDILQLE